MLKNDPRMTKLIEFDHVSTQAGQKLWQSQFYVDDEKGAIWASKMQL